MVRSCIIKKLSLLYFRAIFHINGHDHVIGAERIENDTLVRGTDFSQIKYIMGVYFIWIR